MSKSVLGIYEGVQYECWQCGGKHFETKALWGVFDRARETGYTLSYRDRRYSSIQHQEKQVWFCGPTCLRLWAEEREETCKSSP